MCEIWDLGVVEYREAWELQKRLHRHRVEGRIPDLLLLLEHPPTITIGRSGSPDNVLVSTKQMVQARIPLFFIDRGGDVTYHGLGQLVGYPILDLRAQGRDVHLYVRKLEEVMIRTLRDFSIEADLDERHPGVWVKGEEIGAIGLSVRKWVSMHGFALNVDTDLDHFALINPCGFSDKRATSMSEVIGQKISTAEVADRLKSHFCDLFGSPSCPPPQRLCRNHDGEQV